MSDSIELKIKELNTDIIPPISSRINDTAYNGGCKIVVVGKPGTGKSTLIKALLYSKKHIFPVGLAMSGSEDSNHAYREIMPSSFVYNEYDEERIKSFIKRQKLAQEHLLNPWAVLILDDCTDDPRIFNTPIQQALYKKGRHWKMLYILSLQYALDVKPVIRTNVDGIFILREPLLKNRESLYKNYASIIPDFKTFCELMDQLTDDYTAIYIHGATQSNEWKDCVFYWKAPITPKDWKFGCDDYWAFHDERFDPNYVDTVTGF
jgi:GTPase SAR1 family protein